MGRNNTALNVSITVNVTLKLINQSLMSRNSKVVATLLNFAKLLCYLLCGKDYRREMMRFMVNISLLIRKKITVGQILCSFSCSSVFL